MDIDACRQLNDWLQRIEFPPDVREQWAEAQGDGYHLVLAAEDVPDVEVNGQTVRGGTAVRFPSLAQSPADLAVDVMAALVVRATHEAFEWVRLDGCRLANPHPVDVEEMWEWLAARTKQLVIDYMEHFPGQTDWWCRVTSPDGEPVYEGPAPCPSHLCDISIEDMMAGRMFAFEMSPIHFDGPSHPMASESR